MVAPPSRIWGVAPDRKCILAYKGPFKSNFRASWVKFHDDLFKVSIQNNRGY